MSDKKDLVHISNRNGIGFLTIDSNDRNTLTGETIWEIARKFDQLKKNDEVKIIVLTGHPKAFFSVGADVKEIYSLVKTGDRDKAMTTIKSLQAIFSGIATSSKPTVAAVNGYCLGGGLELALACKYRIANLESTFGLPEIDLGIIPGFGGTQRLPRLIGLKNSVKILFGGKKALISAPTAQEFGLVHALIKGDFLNGVCSCVDDLLNGSLPTCQVVAGADLSWPNVDEANFQTLVQGKASSAVLSLRNAVQNGIFLPTNAALQIEHELFVNQLFSADGVEGLTAFMAKRAPHFQKIEGEQVVVKENVRSSEVVVKKDELTEERSMLRQMVRDFCKDEVAPVVNKMEEEGAIRPALLAKIAELGMFGVPFPAAYGGAGLGKTGYCIMIEELTRIHASLAATVGASVGLAGGSINAYGREAQKQKYLQAISLGKMLGAFGLTESEAGSDVANLKSTATKQGDKWVINGTKQFITNGDIADVIIVFAKTDKDLGANGITAFIVEKNFPGFRSTKVEHKMGIRASRTTSLEFTDMEVPKENVLGRLGDGFKIALNVLNYGRLGLAAGCLGASKRAFELAFEYASQRSQMGKKLLEFQMIQSYFARMRADIFMMESSVYPLAAKADQGVDIRLESAIVKLTASEMSERVIDLALQIHGGLGYMDEYEISRLYRDSRINKIFEGTNEIQQLLIFKEVYKSGGKIE